jgi:hypothetical protein
MHLSDSLKYLVKGSLVLLIIVAPFVYHLVFSYINICIKADIAPLVCNSPFPNLYSYVQ